MSFTVEPRAAGLLTAIWHTGGQDKETVITPLPKSTGMTVTLSELHLYSHEQFEKKSYLNRIYL